MILAFDLTPDALFVRRGSCTAHYTQSDHHVIPLQKQGISTALTSSLMPAITFLCPKIHDLKMIAVTRGPASFTGLRILLSTLQGLFIDTPSPILAPTRFELLAQHAFNTGNLSPVDFLSIHIPTKEGQSLEQSFQRHLFGTLQINADPTNAPGYKIVDEGLDLSQTLFLWAHTLLHHHTFTTKAPFITTANDLVPFYGRTPIFKKKIFTRK